MIESNNTITFVNSDIVPLVTVPDIAHNDDVAVLKFSNEMRRKLQECRERGRGGWEDETQCSVSYLKDLFWDETNKGLVDVVDVANYCMMLHQRGVKFV